MGGGDIQIGKEMVKWYLLADGIIIYMENTEDSTTTKKSARN